MNKSKKLTTKKNIILFVCMLIQAIPFGIAQNIQPLFVPYVVREFNFSLGSFSIMFTIGSLASAIFSPILGKLFGKVQIKILFIMGASLSALGFVSFGFAHSLPAFYLSAAITQIGCVLFSGLGVPYVINSWFLKGGRGKALGIAFSGGSIGNVFLQQIASRMLASKGSSFSYIAFALISIAISLPLILLFIRLPKENEKELLLKDDVVVEKKTTNTIKEGSSFADTKTNMYFWLFALGYAFLGVSISALSTQYGNYFTSDLKMSAAMVGNIGSVFAIACLIGNVSGGLLFDKFGSIKTMALAGVLQFLSIIALIISAKVSYVAFFFSIFYGLNVYSYMSGPAFMATDVFGSKDSSVKLGVISLLFAVGFACGSTIFGTIVDKTSFITGFSTMIIFVILGYSLLIYAIKKYQKSL